MNNLRKRINVKTNRIKKSIIISIVIIIFLLFVSSSVILIEREYFLLESGFKNISCVINKYFINKVYSVNDKSNKMSSVKIKLLENENKKLKNLLDLKVENENYIPATVINHTSLLWYDRLEIDLGYDDVIKDYAVITQDGLVGFIGKISNNASEVKLLTSINKNNMLSVLINTSYGLVAGVLCDYDPSNNLFKITDVISKNKISKGDEVVLSGYNNKNYSGLYVGEVLKEEISNYGLTKTVWVKSNVDFDDLLFVMVVGDEK